MTGPLRLRHRVGAYIARHHLWGSGDRVAVAVSGGMDSIALLDILVETQGWHGGTLQVVTVDHQSGEHSAAHARFVEQVCAREGLPFQVVLGEPSASSEAAWREVRYQAFDALDVDVLALGHHQDDQAATLVLQMLRGAGSKGLGAMRPQRGRYVRPLLEVPREDLRAWAEHRGLNWKEDPTNDDPTFLRNRVRNEVLPLLEELRSGARSTLARSARVLAMEDASLDHWVAQAPPPPWGVAWLQEQPPGRLRRIVAFACPGLDAGQIDTIAHLVEQGRGAVEVGKYRLAVVDEHLTLAIRGGKQG